MLVKIGDQVYDSNTEPIMLILTQEEKELIANMDPKATKFCSYPEDYTAEQIKKFMEDLL